MSIYLSSFPIRKKPEAAFWHLRNSALATNCNPASCKPKKTGESAKDRKPGSAGKPMLPGVKAEELSKSLTCALNGYLGISSNTEKTGFDTVRSIVAARAWSALAARFALTNSGRFCLRQMPHWGTASLLCRGGRVSESSPRHAKSRIPARGIRDFVSKWRDYRASLARNLNQRDCPQGRSLVSVEKSADEISSTGGRRRLSPRPYRPRVRIPATDK